MHARKHLNSWTWCDGINANAPASRVTALPSFICRLAEPLTITMCSFGVCQCHGKTHPAVERAAIMEGPVAGFPLTTAAVAHVGNGGTVVNFISAGLIPGCAGISCA